LKTLASIAAVLTLCFLLAINSWAQPAPLYNFTINTAVGTYPSGDGGPATAALLGFQEKIAVAPGGVVYIADTFNHRIRKVVAGQIFTFAGTGVQGFSGDGGSAASAQLNNPTDVKADASGNVYIYDSGNEVIRKVDANGSISTVAGVPQVGGTSVDSGPANQIKLGLNAGGGMTIDSAGNVYFSDILNCAVRKLTVSTSSISTVAGVPGLCGRLGDKGPALQAFLENPAGLSLDSSGNLYIADYGNSAIRMVSATTQMMTTVAGVLSANGSGGDGGAATSANLYGPLDVAVDAQGNLYIADTLNNKIRKVTAGPTPMIDTIAGSGVPGFSGDGGPAASAVLGQPYGVAVDSSTVYFSDTLNGRVRTISGGIISEFAGADHSAGDGGKASAAYLYFPEGLAWDSQGNLYIADYKNSKVRKVSPAGAISSVAGDGSFLTSGDGGSATSAGVQPQAVAVDKSGNLYIAAGNQVRMVDSQGNISTVVNASGAAGFSGDGGSAVQAVLDNPQDLTTDSDGNLYIADSDNHRIRKVSGGTISTIAGSGQVYPQSNGSFSGDGGLATSANLSFPSGVAFDSDGNLLIADTGNSAIRLLNTTTGDISTVAGTPTKQGFGGDTGLATSALLSGPLGIAADQSGNFYISDTSNNVIRMVDAFGIISTIAGDNHAGFGGDGGTGSSAMINYPFGVAVDAGGNVWFADHNNQRIRELVPSGPSVPGPTAVVNAASFASGGLIPGGMATLFGSNLTAQKGINLASGLPLATDLLKSSIKFNNTIAAPIFAVDNVNGAEQINFQVPWELSKLVGSTVVLQVENNGALGAPVKVPVLAAQPGVFSYTVGANTFGVVLHSNFQLADSAHPVTPGEVVLIYCTNLGVVAPTIADGAPGTGKELTVAKPTVTIGGATGAVSFSGLAPGFVGLDQVNVQVPASLPSGNQPLVVSIGGASSKTVLLPVK